MFIKNYDEVLEQLTSMLKQLQKDLNGYQTDIYLYYDGETEEATLDTFVNVGGNSWINDDHYTIYRDPEHLNSFFDFFNDWSISDFAFYFDMTEQELLDKAVEYFKYYEQDEIDDCLIREFLKDNSEYCEKLYDYYVDEIETDSNGFYSEQAVDILDSFLSEIDRKKESF